MRFDWSSLTRLRINLSMNRLKAGLIAGAIGGVITILLGFFADAFFCGPAFAVLAGVGAGILISRNPDFAGKTASAGGLAGLLAGILLFIGQLLAGNVHVSAPIGHQEYRVLAANVTATARSDATATAKAPTPTPKPKPTPTPKGTPPPKGTATATTGTKTAPPATILTYSTFSGYVMAYSSCLGLVDLIIAGGAGALGGWLAGRNNRVPGDNDVATGSASGA